MSKNKYAQYILVPLLLIVWGTIFYKIYMAVRGESEVMPAVPRFMPVVNDSIPVDNYALLADYKDHFLGKKWAIGGTRSAQSTSRNYSATTNTPRPDSRNNGRPTPPKKDPPKEEPKEKPLPEVLYQGWLTKDADTVVLIKINQQYYPNARAGETRQHVRIESVFKDSLQLSYEGRFWTVLK